jgi:hypothetical protein
MQPQYNAAQMILINLGGTAAMAVAMGDLKGAPAPVVKKVRKVSYGEGLRRHFDRVRHMLK